MKKLNITYDTSKMENDEWITGETCYTVELEDEVADRVLNHSKPSKVTVTRYRETADPAGAPAVPCLHSGQHQAL